MDTVTVKTPEQALAHLFFHFCNKDGRFDEKEIDFIASKFVQTGLNKSLDLKEEIKAYRLHRADIQDDTIFLENVVGLLHPVNTLALYSYCVEICLSDGLITVDEEKLLEDLATVLQIEKERAETAKDIMIERKAVELEKFF